MIREACVSASNDLLVSGLKLLGIGTVSAVLTMATVIGLGLAILKSAPVEPSTATAEADLIQVDVPLRPLR